MSDSDDRDAFAFKVAHWLTLAVCLAVVGGAARLLWVWRINHFQHAVATITEVEDIRVRVSRRRGWLDMSEPRYVIHTYGKIKFTRTKKGLMFDCEKEIRLGEPKDKFMVGQTIDVVPGPDSCNRVEVLDRIN